MLVTLTGAFRNAGDYLIGHRGRALLRKYVDEEIVDINRLAISSADYKILNQAKAIILCGGPAYQSQIFPKIYPLEMDQIETRIVPMGLGWKGALNQKPEDFQFPAEAQSFIRQIHSNINHSSVRDNITLEILNSMGIRNVSMTGCPAWYDLESMSKDYHFDSNPKRIVFSLPAKPQADTFGIVEWISKQFPRADKVFALHHGWRPSKSVKGNEMRNWHLRVAGFGLLRGWRTASIADGLDKMLDLYGKSDLHVGFRVHAHLLSLSQRKASLLIAEDSRGVGQVEALGGSAVLAGAGAQASIDALTEHFDSKGAAVAQSVKTMNATFPKMQAFLESIGS
jgi:Polysaccharide pyruvyl transferase